MKNVQTFCPACEASAFFRIADLGSTTLERCRRCGLVVNRIACSIVARDYYGDEYDGLYENYYRIFRERQFKDVLCRLEGVDFPTRRVLDIGCSYGWFLKEAKAKGFDVIGAEPSAKAFNRLTADKALEVYNCGIEGISRINGTFGLITMWNVFEHLQDPRVALNLVHAKLENQGVILICVPDVSGIITRMSFLAHTLTMGKLRGHLLRLYQMDNDFPHLFHYSKQSLEIILRKNGFEPFLAWGQDIVDAENLGERIEGYTGAKTPFKHMLVMALGGLQKLARLTRMQDELVVLARKV